jgi:predicted nucleic-acid-binding protein
MKAIDTNVLVRYLVQDDPIQGRKAASFIESAAAVGDQILIGNIVLCELVWVLDSAYGYSKPEISTSIEKLLQTGTFKFEAKDVARTALEEYRAAKVDFADCLLGRLHKEFGCDVTMTFDTALRKLGTFQLLWTGPANLGKLMLNQAQMGEALLSFQVPVISKADFEEANDNLGQATTDGSMKRLRAWSWSSSRSRTGPNGKSIRDLIDNDPTLTRLCQQIDEALEKIGGMRTADVRQGEGHCLYYD